MKNRVAGFTVVELLMVVGTMGVLTAVALPRIDLSRYRAIASMQAIGTTLLASQRLAVSRQHNVVVSFDQAASAMLVHQDANNDNLVNGA
jgi:type II secretory pathway pseudopilin PulG